MQIDIHFYGTYCLARAAGIVSETAHTIAMASQFVNDATAIKSVIVGNRQCLRPVRTSFKQVSPPYQEQDAWLTWIPFHFLPGNTPEEGTFEEKIVCQKNSLTAQKVALFALDESHQEVWPYLIGIAAHAYADTFSHYGFSGLTHKQNRIREDSIRLDKNHQPAITEYLAARSSDFKDKYPSDDTLLPTGHAQAATYPDRPYLKWRFEYVTKGSGNVLWRDNTADYMEACECLFYFFQEFAKKNTACCDPKTSKQWTDISPIVRFILGVEGPCDQRIPVWKRNLLSGVFCELTPVDQELHYDSHRWQLNRAVWESEETGDTIDRSHACLFYKAARRFQRFVLEELLVKMGLLL
ncbi:MAG: hypothetical protein HQK75_05385 [Candidatus Magnetomorum sp.]|nr:hypothetical protein [Candidatus Magnetomorum sp.]